MKSHKELFLILSMVVCIPSAVWSMDDGADERASLISKYPRATRLQPQYPLANDLITKFNFTDKDIINFLKAVEDNKSINKYLKMKAITGEWRILGAAYSIAKQKGYAALAHQLHTILSKIQGLQ